MDEKLVFDDDEKNVGFFKHIWNEITDFFYYSIWDHICTAYYNLTWFFHNIKVFWSTLWQWRDWDHKYAIDTYCVMLEELAKRIETGVEESRAAKKKAKKIRELIELLKIDIDDVVLDKIMEDRKKNGMTSKKLDKWHDKGIKIRKQHRDKIFKILDGQDPIDFANKYAKEVDKLKERNPKKFEKGEHDWQYDTWVKIFDGSGAEGWWE